MEMVTVSSDQFRQEWGKTVDVVLSGKAVMVERYNRPAMVVLKCEYWEDIQVRLAMLDAIMEADKVLARPPDEGWVSNAEMRERMEKRGVFMVD
ncbi:MAG: hypothetical protein R3C14_53180 [Caldilineaceae bacterium]